MMTNRAQRWNRDTQLEEMAGKFLDQTFYRELSKKTSVKRHRDTYHQFGGVDITVGQANVDEKCKIRGCLNEVLGFVGFECTMLNKAGFVQAGWFLNPSLSTDYYAIVGLSATADDDKKLSAESQISAADILWVKKQDVIDYVESFEGHYGQLTLSQISCDAEELRRHADSGYVDIFGNKALRDGKARSKYPHRKYWLTYSTHLPERPVNLVLPREALESLPHTKHYVVTRDKISRV